MHLLRQSQQACNIWQQALSPLTQVTQQPSLVISHSHLHMTMLHWQTTMPFIMQQQLHMPSHIMRHMFCNMAQAISSSHLQWILMPLGHFSIFIVQQGTMHVPMPVGIDIGMPEVDIGVPMLPIAPIIPRSIIIMLDIVTVLLVAALAATLASSLGKRTAADPLPQFPKPKIPKPLSLNAIAAIRSRDPESCGPPVDPVGAPTQHLPPWDRVGHFQSMRNVATMPITANYFPRSAPLART